MNFAPPPSSSTPIIHSSVDPACPDMCFWFDKCAIKTRRLAATDFSRRPRRMCALRFGGRQRGGGTTGTAANGGAARSDARQTGSRPPRFQSQPLRGSRRRRSGALVSSRRHSVVSSWWKDEKSHKEGGGREGEGERVNGFEKHKLQLPMQSDE